MSPDVALGVLGLVTAAFVAIYIYMATKPGAGGYE
jgi:hypothetical protein